MKKLILAIHSLTCCEGCQVELLNLGEKLLKLFEIFNLGNFSWAEEKKEALHYDIVLVEGTPLTDEDFKNLKRLRKKSKILIAFGTCAHLGGVQEIKNYHGMGKKECLQQVYAFIKRIANPNVVPLHRVVKVDYFIPGCPVDKEEVWRVLSDLYAGKPIKLPKRPVCYECQKQEYECLLQKGEPCLGPIIWGGCQAICLKSKRFCYGCRGPIPGISAAKHLCNLQKLIGEKNLKRIMQTFGAEDEILRQL